MFKFTRFPLADFNNKYREAANRKLHLLDVKKFAAFLEAKSTSGLRVFPGGVRFGEASRQVKDAYASFLKATEHFSSKCDKSVHSFKQWLNTMRRCDQTLLGVLLVRNSQSADYQVDAGLRTLDVTKGDKKVELWHVGALVLDFSNPVTRACLFEPFTKEKAPLSDYGMPAVWREVLYRSGFHYGDVIPLFRGGQIGGRSCLNRCVDFLMSVGATGWPSGRGFKGLQVVGVTMDTIVLGKSRYDDQNAQAVRGVSQVFPVAQPKAHPMILRPRGPHAAPAAAPAPGPPAAPAAPPAPAVAVVTPGPAPAIPGPSNAPPAAPPAPAVAVVAPGPAPAIPGPSAAAPAPAAPARPPKGKMTQVKQR